MRDRGLKFCVNALRKGPLDPFRSNVNLALITLCELEISFFEGEQRIIATATYILAGMDMRSALTDDDITGRYVLAGELLHAKTLCLGIASVP
jgi:hypothetical protein